MMQHERDRQDRDKTSREKDAERVLERAVPPIYSRGKIDAAPNRAGTLVLHVDICSAT
jgi:hypothetical protein